MRQLNRHVPINRIQKEVERFLRKQASQVQRIRVTHIVKNARNPHEDMWLFWGTRMLKVWGDADVLIDSIEEPVTLAYQVEIYITRDGSKMGHGGKIVGGDELIQKLVEQQLKLKKVKMLDETAYCAAPPLELESSSTASSQQA